MAKGGYADPERLVRTLRRVGSIADARVLPVLDAAVSEDFAYYVRPASNGPTLRDRPTRDREVTIADAIRLARELAAALGVAHTRWKGATYQMREAMCTVWGACSSRRSPAHHRLRRPVHALFLGGS